MKLNMALNVEQITDSEAEDGAKVAPSHFSNKKQPRNEKVDDSFEEGLVYPRNEKDNSAASKKKSHNEGEK
jgi:hypothetical protein